MLLILEIEDGGNMEQQLGFIKGMSQDVSPLKRDKDSYYEALNIRVITDEGDSTGSITNDKGNTLLFRIPQLNKSAKITNIKSGSSAGIKIDGTSAFNSVSTKLPGETWCDALYKELISNSTIAAWITAGKVYLKNNRVELKIVILDTYLSTNNIWSTDATLVSMTPGSSETPRIVNYTQMRDSLILFTTFTSGEYGQIWKLDYDFENSNIINLNGEYLVPAEHLVYVETLELPSDKRIAEVMTKYSNPNYGKVYWTNGITLRHLNILDPDSLGTPLGYTELLPDVALTSPRFISVEEGGALKAGMIQYAYQLYNYGGSETIVSPTTPLIHLVQTPTSDASTSQYRGSEIETNTSKLVRFEIKDIDLRFDYIKIWSVFYAQKGSPVINLIIEDKIKGTDVEYIDTGNISLDTLTQAEFASIGGVVFNPGSLTTKDNHLICGDITEDVFDIDEELGYTWDARAYRWKLISGVWKFKIDDAVATDTTGIEEDADCLFLEDYYDDGFKYNNLTGRLGGNGTNISYAFQTVDTFIDSSATNATTTFVNKATFNWKNWIDSDFDNVTDFPDPSGIYTAGWLTGYQPREVYRFGIEFYDSKGRRSFVKWIGDIRIPDYHEMGSSTILGGGVRNLATVDSSNSIKSSSIGIKFEVNNVPSGYSWRIVRTERTDKDKTVIDTAILKGVVTRIGNTTNGKYLRPFLGLDGGGISLTPDDYYTNKDMWVAVSPNICFRNINSLTGFKVEKCGYFDSNSYYVLSNEDFGITLVGGVKDIKTYLIKFKSFTPETADLGTISDSVGLGIGYETAYTLTGETLAFYNSNYPYDNDSNAQDPRYGGRGILFKSNTTFSQAAGKSLLVHFIKDGMDYSRYGGTTYAARTRNDYIPCSTIKTGNTSAKVFRGDTYNLMFDYQDMSSALSDFDLEDSYITSSTGFVPMPSSLNTCLRHDTCVSKTSNFNQIWKLQDSTETGEALYNNKGDDADFGEYPTTYTDLYLINPVYNMQNTTVRGFPKPLNYNSNTRIDYRIISSQPSIAGESVDSWTKFLSNDYIDLDSQHGAINKLLINNNTLLALQDTGFAAVGFKDRQLLNEGSESQLVLGTGSILSYVQYISTKTGCRNKWSVIDLDRNFMWFDASNRKIMRYGGEGLEILSDSKNMSGWFKETYPSYREPDLDSDVHAVVDKKDNRVYFTFLRKELNPVEGGSLEYSVSRTISYNLMMGTFESLHSFTPQIFLETEIGLMSTGGVGSVGTTWLHGSDAYNTYYGEVEDSYITHILGSPVKATFTNLEFNSDDTAPDKIYYWNSYGNNLANNNIDNLVRRFRTYRTPIPRQGYSDGSQRFVDYWLKFQIIYENQTSKFRLDDITVKYLNPLI